MSILQIFDVIEGERIKQKLTVTELCRHAGLNRNSYYKWAKGKVTPNIVTVSLVMDVLNLVVEIKRR